MWYEGWWPHWHRHGHAHACCPPRRLFARGLLHLIILKALKEQPLYGSELLKVLKEKFGVEVSSPAVYGALRKLEFMGFVTSTWDTSGTGPARRVYRITEEGLAHLEESLERLRELRKLTEELLT